MKIKTTKLHTIALGALFLTGLAQAETTPQPTLEQRLAIVERKLELAQEEAAAKAKDAPVLPKVSGYIQADYRDFVDDAGAFTDQFLVRRARLIVDGTLHKSTDYRFQVDFAGGTTVLLDAYAEFKARPYAKLRVGKFKGPVGLERLQTDTATIFSETALPSNLVPNRDAGVQLSGDLSGGRVAYQLAVTNGVVDGTNGETDTNDGKDYTGRVFITPGFGLGLGIAASVGDQSGTAASSQLPSFRTYGQQTFFSYVTGAFANGERTRISPQAYWYTGPAGLLAEYVSSRQRVTRTNTSATLENTAWQTAVTYVLTGENNSFRGIKPRQPFDASKKQWGALEVGARFSRLDVDDDAFPLYASVSASARQAQAWAAVVSWYPSQNVRVSTSHENTSFKGGATGGQDRRDEKVILARVQLTY